MAVRREKVELVLEDRFSRGMAQAAAATQLLDRNLNSLSGSAVQADKTTRQIEKDVDSLGKTAKRTEKDIDKLSGRLRILADVAAILGPTLAPIGAVSAAAIGGLASQLGFAAVGAGTAVLAFQGVGDALKALNKAELEPTAQNLEAARIEMERLSPAAADFAQKLMSLKPGLQELQGLAASGMFPGLARGLDGLESALPRVERLITAISTEVGNIAGDAGESLGSARWAPFLDFVAEEGPSALRDFATAAGNTAHALAALWMGTDPLNDEFSKWLVDATADLDRWAQGVGETEGFADFLDYVRETGPQVGATLGALANAALQIVEAAAPLGGPILKGLEAAADVISAIADSDLGTPIFTAVTALALFNRTMAVTEALTKKTSMNVATIGSRARNLNLTRGGVGKAGLAAGGVALAASGFAGDSGVSNTASLGLIGAIGGFPGAAVGAAVGAVIDFSHANDGLAESLERVDRAIANNNLGDYKAGIDDLNSQLKDIQNTSGIGDFFSDFGKSTSDFFSNPLNTLTMGPSQGERLKAQIKAKEAAKEQADALAAVAAAEADVATYNSLMNEGLYATQAGLNTATGSAEDFRNSLIAVNEVLDQRGTMRSYEAAIDDFDAALKKNGRTLDINTEKGRENQAALDAIVAQGTAAAEKIADPIQRSKFLDKVRDQFVDAAAKILGSRKEAKKLADQLGVLDQMTVNPKVALNTTPAAVALDRFLTQARRNRIVIPVTTSTNANLGDQVANNGVKKAAGGMIYGPGTTTSDSIPAMLSNEEFVVRAAAVRHYGPDFFYRANRMQLAGGGFVDDGYSAPGYRDPEAVKASQDKQKKDADKAAAKAGEAALRRFEKQLEKSSKALDKERTKREALLAKADDIRSSITSGYRSDIFASGSGSNIWQSAADRKKAGTGDVFSMLMGDTANLGALSVATAQLKKKGLDGAALADLLSNGSLEQVQAFAASSAADVQRYETLYNQREKALVSAGNVGVNAAFGPQLAAARAAVIEARKLNNKFQRVVNLLERNPKATADQIARAMRGAAPKRPRKGN